MPNKVEQVLNREDGSEVKLVAQEMFGRGLVRSVDVYALHREHAASPWRTVSDRPHPNWRNMSRSEYVTHGRSELLTLVSSGQIMKLVASLPDGSSYVG